MAEFCLQCATDEGFACDFVGLQTALQTEMGYLTPELCEGCGFCYVDHTGKCCAPDCMERHGAFQSGEGSRMPEGGKGHG